MIYHVSPSKGQRCGIASFAAKLNDNLHDAKCVSELKEVEDDSPVLIEHEYGLHNKIDWEHLASMPNKKVIIQHAVSHRPEYVMGNETTFRVADKIIFLSNRCRIEATNRFPQHVNKFVVLPHYCEPLRHDPVSMTSGPVNCVIGIHGFAFPRNGFMRLLNEYKPGGSRIYLMASINEFNNTAEMETAVYIDKMRRKIWQIEDETGSSPVVRLDFGYHDTKEEIIDILKENCDILVHLTTPWPNYWNASGSINVLLATGLPVFALNGIFSEAFPTDVVNRIDNAADIFDGDKWKVTSTPEGIRRYHEENSIKRFANRIDEIVNSVA